MRHKALEHNGFGVEIKSHWLHVASSSFVAIIRKASMRDFLCGPAIARAISVMESRATEQGLNWRWVASAVSLSLSMKPEYPQVSNRKHDATDRYVYHEYRGSKGYTYVGMKNTNV